MRVLALDASTEVLALALSWEGGLISHCSRTGLSHAEHLVPAMEGMLADAGLKPADIQLVSCAAGPGSFTGLRIALSAAKGFCLASGAALVLPPTLDYLALACPWPRTVVPMIDARKGRAYAAIYRSGRRSGDWLDLTPQDLAARLDAEEELVFTGPGADLMADLAAERPGWALDPLRALPRPECLVDLGLRLLREAGPAGPGAGPLYVREEEADIGITRRAGSEAP